MASPLKMYNKFKIRHCSAKIVILVGKQPMADCYSSSGHIYVLLFKWSCSLLLCILFMDSPKLSR